MWKSWTIVSLILLLILVGLFSLIQFNNAPLYSVPESSVSIAQPQATSTPVIEKVYVPVKNNNQQPLQNCLAAANTNYQNKLKSNTVWDGSEYIVPPIFRSAFDQELTNDQDVCFKEFPQN